MSSALSISSSGNILSLDSKILASLCSGKFFVDIQPSVFIDSGALNVLGASVKITSPTGVVIKNYSTSGYDIFDDSPAMQSVIEVAIPRVASNYQYGNYKVEVKLTDSDGTEYVVTKTVKLCEPDKDHKTRDYGLLSAIIKGICKIGKLFITADTPPNYKGLEVESQENVLKLEYPTSSGLSPITDAPISSFSARLYEGVYKLTGTICALYDAGDNISYEVLYKVKKEKTVKCIIDECCIFAKLAELHKSLGEKCTADEVNKLSSIVVETLRLYKTAVLAADCGEDPSDYITDLEALLGCKCTCNCNEGTPIINNAPSKDFVIEGCNVSKETIGLTDYYTIENYTYVVAPNVNGGVLTVGSLSVVGCQVTIPLNFNIGVAYTQIKGLANTDYIEWAKIINKSLNGINPLCLGITQLAWDKMSLTQRVNAIVQAVCSGGSCSAEIGNDDVSADGSDAIFTWDHVTSINDYDLVDIFIDDIIVGTVKASLETFRAVGKADGVKHTYAIVSKCSNGVFGNALDGDFTFFGCPAIAPPVVSLSSVTEDCPYDLTALVEALPSGIEAEWHNANNTKASSLVADPANAIDGTYYVFAKNADNCYSVGVKVILVCNGDTGCSAPQNVVVESLSEGFRIRFVSAAYPPPGNSYTVKRKLASDPDVDGSYTTIGTPTYNATVERWEIEDADATNNILYTYKVISNCTDSAPYVLYNVADLDCPALSLTPNATSIDYSFVPVGGDVDKYEVEIWTADGLTKVHTDTHTPAFSNPTTGTFIYLDGGVSYKVRVKVFIDTYSKTCDFSTTTTDAIYEIAYSNNSHAADPIQLGIGNLNTSPTTFIFNGNYDTDPVTGSHASLPAVNANVLIAVGGGKTITSCSCNGVSGPTGGGSASWSNVNGSVIITLTTD